MGDFLGGVIGNHGKMIARRRIRARQHDIAPNTGIGQHIGTAALGFLAPGQRGVDALHRRRHIKPPGVASAGCKKGLTLVFAALSVDCGVERRAIGIARPLPAAGLKRFDMATHLAARQKGRIGEAHGNQLFEHHLIVCKMLRLAKNRRIKVDSEPVHILDQSSLEGRRRADLVDILYSEQKPPTCRLRQPLVFKRGERMTKMQIAVRAWGETENGSILGSFHAMRYPVLRTQEGVRPMQRLRNGDDLEKALSALCGQSPLLAGIVRQCPEIPLRLMPPGFAGLAQVVTGQMISKQAAAAIFARLSAACPTLSARAYLALAPETLTAIGLTRAKHSTLHAIARAIDDGTLDLAALDALEATESLALLTSYRGIGEWTAEVYLMFSVGHLDIFPAGDLALRIAATEALGKCERLESSALRTLAEQWRPYRSVAARILWAHYAKITRRDVLPVG